MPETNWLNATESDWLNARDFIHSLWFIMLQTDKGSERKLRLYAAACCRRIWHLLPDECCRTHVELAERYAEGLVSEEQLLDGWSYEEAEPPPKEASAVSANWIRAFARKAAYYAAAALPGAGTHARYHIRGVPSDTAFVIATKVAEAPPKEWSVLVWNAALEAEREAQTDLLREIFGNPFRPVTLDPSFQTPSILTLAQSAYDNRTLPEGTLDPKRLEDLAVALEAAGCQDAELLGHLRSTGPHVRGCWALDAVLGKA